MRIKKTNNDLIMFFIFVSIFMVIIRGLLGDTG